MQKLLLSFYFHYFTETKKLYETLPDLSKTSSKGQRGLTQALLTFAFNGALNFLNRVRNDKGN